MSYRAAAGAALLAAFVLGSHALLLAGLPWRAAPGEDEASRVERRLAHYRDTLPARGTACYRAEPPVTDTEKASRRYFLAEYVLCPVVIEPGEGEPLVIDTETP